MTFTAPLPAGLTDTVSVNVTGVGAVVKFAVTVLSQSAIRVVGLAEPVTSPLQWEKKYPLARTASRVTVDPVVIPGNSTG